MCVMISAGRQTDLHALTSSSSSSPPEGNNATVCTSVRTCRKKTDAEHGPARASIRLFFQGRCGDPQAAVRTRCIHTHFANDARLPGSDKEVSTCKPIKWLTYCSVLAEALGRRCAKHTGQAWHRHATLLRGLAMHATAFSPVLIHTVLEEMKKQMCSDGQLAAVDLKWRGPIPREHAFDGRPRSTKRPM